MALGTPAYMAPEQGAADPLVDHRADIYAFGCLAYEILSGQVPFVGRSAAALLAAHATETPEAVERRRPSLPPALGMLVMRCLEKRPADRWQTAEELLHQLDPIATPSGGMAPTAPVEAVRPRARRRPVVLGALLVAAVAGGVLLFIRRAASPAKPLAQDVVAVFPFRVSGADPQLAYLSEGMVDLLATQLTGEGGPRAVDPQASLSAWQRARASATDARPDPAARAARDLGAGMALEGSVVGTPARLVLAATLRNVETGASRGQAKIEGSADSLPVLVDRLTGQLLLESAGREERSTATLTPLPALRAYLDGQAAYRHGNYQEAVRHFDRALQSDSTFALAGLYRVSAAGWCCAGSGRALRLAWAGRDRLSPADRALLLARAGPRYPGVSSHAELLKAWEQAVASAPERPDAWYGLGDVFFHQGRVLGLASSWERAREAFHRALALDSAFAGPLQHLVEMAARAGDTAEARALVGVFFRADSASEKVPYLRWRLAVLTGDSAALRALRADFGTMLPETLWEISQVVEFDGVSTEDIRPVLQALAARATTTEERADVFRAQWIVALNAGRPLEAQAALRELGALDGRRERSQMFATISATFSDGDSAAGAEAARRLGAGVQAEAPDSAARTQRVYGRCTLGHWDLAAGRVAPADQAAAFLRSGEVGDLADEDRVFVETCAYVLEAWAASQAGRADARQRIAALDSLLLTGPANDPWTANLVLSRLWEHQGDLPRALAAVRRRAYWSGVSPLLTTYLNEEGRLAALTGDTLGAIQAYQHYLALRRDPEPAVAPQVEQVKAELAKLLAER